MERGDGKRLRLLRSKASVFYPSYSRLALRVGWGPLQCKVMGYLWGTPLPWARVRGFRSTLLSSRVTFSWDSGVPRMEESSFSSSNFGMRLIYEISAIALLWCCA